MKLPKSLTTVTPLSKLLAMILFILFHLMGFLLGMEYQKVLDEPKINAKEVAAIPKITPTIDAMAGWKTYENKDLGYTIQYPTDWTEFTGAYGAQSNFNGKQQSLSITWSQHAADQGNAGGCISPCHFIVKNKLNFNTYNWLLLKQLPQTKDNTGFIIRATINVDNIENRRLIDQILSTFKFTK